MKGKKSYKFTRKKQSKRGMFALGMAALSGVLFVAVVFLSFRSGGNGSLYLGSVGVASLLLSVGGFILAVAGLKEENSFRFFPCLAAVVSFVTAGIWTALYVAGIML